jgi:hypothetical protein
MKFYSFHFIGNTYIIKFSICTFSKFFLLGLHFASLIRFSEGLLYIHIPKQTAILIHNYGSSYKRKRSHSDDVTSIRISWVNPSMNAICPKYSAVRS